MNPLTRFLRGRLALNTSLSLFWQLARVGAQALWLWVIARKIGAGGYGTFAGVAGLATFLGAFSGMGLGLLLLRAVAREPALLGAYWHKGLHWTIGSGLAIALVFMVLSLSAKKPDAGLAALLAIGLSETVLFPLISFCAFAFNAHERAGLAAALPAMTAIIRLAGAGIFLLSPVPATIGAYSAIHLVTTSLAAVTAITLTRMALRPGPAAGRVTRNELVDGLGYSSLWAATNALTSLDKTLVLHFAGGTVAGLYAAAYRLTMLFALPVDALAMSSLPRVFRHDDNPAAGRRLVMKMFAAGLTFSLIAACLLYSAAGVLPWLLGPSFDDAAAAARMLVWLLPAYALRLLGSNTLLGLDGQWMRLAIESFGVLLLCLTAWFFVHGKGLQGAALMIVTTEGCLALVTWCAVALRLRPR